MKKWYSMIPDGTIDYAIRNNRTGEIEAIIARNCGHRGWIRFTRSMTGGWEISPYANWFNNLKEVKAYYDKVNH